MDVNKMDDDNDLTPYEKAVLFACCDANNFSLHSHVPPEYVRKRIKNIPAKYIKKAFKTLFAKGYILKHPARRSGMTIQLTKKGLQVGLVILDEIRET